MRLRSLAAVVGLFVAAGTIRYSHAQPASLLVLQAETKQSASVSLLPKQWERVFLQITTLFDSPHWHYPDADPLLGKPLRAQSLAGTWDLLRFSMKLSKEPSPTCVFPISRERVRMQLDWFGIFKQQGFLQAVTPLWAR